VGAELFQFVLTHGRAGGDMTKLIFAFRNLADLRNQISFAISPECCSTTEVKNITVALSVKKHKHGRFVVKLCMSL
jgi:hypothetical protein